MSENELLESGSVRDVVSELFRRVSHTELSNAELKRDVQALAGKVDSLVGAFEKFGERINRGTDWHLIWAAAGIILSICGGCGWLVTEPLRQDIQKLESHAAQAADDAKRLAVLEERSRWQKFPANGVMGDP